MSVSSVLAKDYEDISNSTLGENKPNSNPIQSQTNPISPAVATKQTQFKPEQTEFQAARAAPIPTGGVPESPERRAQSQGRAACESFLFLTLVWPSYNPAMQTWTIQKLLNWITDYLTGKGIDSPRLSAELLLSHVVGLKRIDLYTQFDTPVEQTQLDRLHSLVRRAGEHEPIAYLVGKTEFYSLEIDVTGDCMIPRPETELLVQNAVEFLRTRNGTQLVCDLCTGSGCIAVAIAKSCPDMRIIATDSSEAALRVAAQNVRKYQLNDRIELLCGDLFDPLAAGSDASEFDLIVCNPPYVSAAEFETLDKNVKDYEPRSALHAGRDGLGVYRKIVEKVDRFLKPTAALMLEIGYAQGEKVAQLLEQANVFIDIKMEKDFQDHDRVVIAKKTSTCSG
jgi:release factor glutamine methyltransferase